MKLLIIGGAGTIGKKVVEHFQHKYQTITAGRKSGDVVVDITKVDSITTMFQTIGFVDAIICLAGEAKWANFNDLTEDDFYIGLKNKLMGQVNLVKIGKNYLNKNGSFTLSSGILADDPVMQTTSAAMVNGAIHSFVQAVALELENGQRINAVSCGVVEDSYEKYKDYFPGHNAIPMNRVINGYVRSVEGKDNGKIIRIYN